MTLTKEFAGGNALTQRDEQGICYDLDGRAVNDEDVLEVRTDTGWMSGHYTAQVHPESGALAFAMHVRLANGSHEHVVVHVPHDALFRWPID